MRRVCLTLGVLSVIILPALDAARGQTTTSPGKRTVFAADSGYLDANGDITPIVGTIQKGKKKCVLKVDAVIEVDSSAFDLWGVYLSVSANGLPLEPTGFLDTECANGGDDCALSGSFWIDMERNLGVFGKVPVVIQVDGGHTILEGGHRYTVSFAAQMLKK